MVCTSNLPVCMQQAPQLFAAFFRNAHSTIALALRPRGLMWLCTRAIYYIYHTALEKRGDLTITSVSQGIGHTCWVRSNNWSVCCTMVLLSSSLGPWVNFGNSRGLGGPWIIGGFTHSFSCAVSTLLLQL